jgi:3-phosphoshikimate 1-carboxyvinyltransferase
MRAFVAKPITRLKGEISLLGDKSIAHRLAIISAISQGTTRIENFPANKDCLTTLKVLQELGVSISLKRNLRRFSFTVTVVGRGLFGLKQPKSPIFMGDSGTSLRLMLGILAGQNFTTELFAGKSLSHRPMLRVTEPLRLMGARIKSRVVKQESALRLRSGLVSRGVKPLKVEECPPITITGGNLKPFTYKMPVASAQVKSAILLAALYAKGKTTVIEPVPTRNHTECILNLYNAGIKVFKNTIVINNRHELSAPKKIFVPGDISSAAFFMVLATIIPNARVLIKDVCFNPSRIGIIKILKRMGANIKAKRKQIRGKIGEPLADIIVKSSKLKATTVKEKEIPSLIDELPILMIAACKAKGVTVFEGISELRVKETDRVRSMYDNLKKMGAGLSVYKTGNKEKLRIRGLGRLKGAKVKSFGDHRTAMCMVVAGLVASGSTKIDNISCINKSFPDFINLLNNLMST